MTKSRNLWREQLLPLHHVDLGPVLEKLHFIHELIDEEDSATVIGIDVLPHGRSRNGSGVEA